MHKTRKIHNILHINRHATKCPTNCYPNSNDRDCHYDYTDRVYKLIYNPINPMEQHKLTYKVEYYN